VILKVLKLIDGDLVFGEVEAVHGETTEILMKNPFIAKPAGVMPYCVDLMTSAPAAIQINPVNIIWSAPLEDFPKALEIYQEATSKIIKPDSKIIV